MTKTSPTSGSFTINRHFNHGPDKVFDAFSTPATKAKWFTGPKGGEALERVIDVKAGGSEVLRFRHPSGMITHFTARYHSVEKNKRIVYSYDLMIDEKHHSTSLAAVELVPAGNGTDMIFTEHVAWHDGTELAKGLASREHGTSWQFDNVAEVLGA
jgi:uncharacterized protein YndB with AHSA1/START domain